MLDNEFVYRIAYPLAPLRTGLELGGASRHPTTSAGIKIVKAKTKGFRQNFSLGAKDHLLYVWGQFISINFLDPALGRPIIDFAWWQLQESLLLGKDLRWIR